MDVSQIVGRRGDVACLLHPIAALCRILQQVVGLCIGTHECRELVESRTISGLRELNLLFDNGCGIFLGHAFACKHLHDDVALWSGDVLNLVHSHGVERHEIVARVVVHRRRSLILLAGQPSLLPRLSVFLRNDFEVGTSRKRGVDRVSRLACRVDVGTTHLNLAVFNGVGQLLFRQQTHKIERIVHLILGYSRGLSDRHGIELRRNVGRISRLGEGQSQVVHQRSTLAHHVGRVFSRSQIVGIACKFLLQSSTVGLRRSHLNVDIFDVATFHILAETGLQLVVFFFQIAVADLHLVVLNGVIGEGSQLNLALLVFLVECHLCCHRVRQDAMCQQCLIFLCQQLLAQGLFNECPIFVDGFILLCHLRIGIALRVIFGQELLQRIGIETAGLLVHKRSLHQHGVGALFQHILHLFIGDAQAQFLCFVLHNLGLDIGVPNHVFHLV